MNKTLREFLLKGPAHAPIRDILKDLEYIGNFISTNNIDLNKPIPHSPKHTYLREILLVIDHNAYHAGKILLIRKYFANWPG